MGTEHQPEAPADYWERKAQPVVIREGAEVLALSDAGRVEAAAAILERRYPAARPDVLDTVISELHSVARAWRRMAGGVLAAAETTPIGPECFADSTGSVISWKGENFYRPGARPGDSPTWEELGLSLTRERDALFAEVCELRRALRDATSTTRLAVKDPEPLVLPPDEFAAFKLVAERSGYLPPVAAELTPAQCARLDRMVPEYGDAIGAVRQAVDLLAARIHSAEDARIISAARDALRVLEGAEDGPGPSDAQSPASASPEPAAAATGPARAKDGSEGGMVTRLCPTCLHDGVLERTLDRAAAAEARLAGIAAMARDAVTSAPSGMTPIVAAERILELTEATP